MSSTIFSLGMMLKQMDVLHEGRTLRHRDWQMP
jgi:hypothetical protein